MLNNGESVKKIDERFVRKNCVQVMEPYWDNITILSKDGLLFSNSNDGDINKYISDYRKHKFPYSNIPMHKSFSIMHGKITYVNQLFDYNKSYFIFRDGEVTENIIFRHNGDTNRFEKRIEPRMHKLPADGINFDLLMKDFMTIYGETYFLLSSGYLLTGFDDFVKEFNDQSIIKKAIKNYEDTVWKITSYYGDIFIEGAKINKKNEATFYHIDATNLKNYDLNKLKIDRSNRVPMIRPFLNPEISREKIKRANQKIKKLKTV